MLTRALSLIATACLFAACAARPAGEVGGVREVGGKSGRFMAAPGQYHQAFDIARDELAAVGFTLDRVDAYTGIISTRAKASGGLATPWDREQTSLGSEVADLMHPQQRIVRITFIPADLVGRVPDDEPVTQISGEGAPPSVADLGQSEPLVGKVEVMIERVYRPYRRVSTVDVLRTSRTTDPSLRARGMSSSFAVVTQRDHALEERLASRIATRLQSKP